MSDWKIIGITYAEMPKLRHHGLRAPSACGSHSSRSTSQFSQTNSVSGGVPYSVAVSRCSSADRKFGSLGNGPDDADRQVLPLEPVERQ